MLPMKRLKIDVYTLLRHAALAVLAAGMLVSCATPDKQPGAETVIPDVPVETGPAAAMSAVPTQPLTEELVYDILLAEIAGQRGQLDVSAPHYLQAALEASDPRVAERAVQVASYGKQYDIARKAAHRWVELDPDNIEARKELLKLSLHTGTLDEVIEQLDYLQQLTSSPEQAYQLSTAVLASSPGFGGGAGCCRAARCPPPGGRIRPHDRVPHRGAGRQSGPCPFRC